MTTRIFIADDQQLLASALGTILNSQEDLDVFGIGTTGQSAIDNAHRADVILLDVKMPGMDGLVALQKIKERASAPKVIMLTTFNSPSAVEESIVSGADGFLLKDADPDYLIRSVRSVSKGDSVLSAGVTGPFLESWRKHHALTQDPDKADSQGEETRELLKFLTRREVSVLQLISRGFSNQEIASELYISQTTVKSHVSSILSKLNARDRVALVILARDAGIGA